MERRRRERLVSLDVFRGITIAGMLLVNNPGSWSTIYGPLKHAPWHGWRRSGGVPVVPAVDGRRPLPVERVTGIEPA